MAVNDEIMNNLAQYEGGGLNERIYNFLGNLGYTGALSDRLANYSSEGRNGWQGLLEDLGIWTPAQLFSQGEQGLFFVPKPVLFGSQFLYQDSAGTTLTDAHGDPVGLGLEWSRGLELGPQLVTNADFGAATDWTLQAGFSISGGKLVIDNAGGYASQPLPGLEVGYYEFSIVVDSISAAKLTLELGGSIGRDFEITTPGSYTFRRYWPGTDSTIYVNTPGSSVTAVVDSVSLRKISGNHLTQSVSADRPTYNTDGSLHWLAGNGSNWHLNAGQALNLETFTATIAVRVAGSNERALDNRGTGTLGTVPGWHIKALNDDGGGTGDMVVIDDGAGNYWRFNDPVNGASAGTVRIMTVRYTQNDALVRINGEQIAPHASSSSMGSILSAVDGNLFTASNNIGAQTFGGDFYGGIVTSDFLSILDIERVENYLAKRAGVTL